METPILEVKNLKKYFKTPTGNLHAVDDVSFSINKGETFGVVGESGCGKSTMGRVIVNLLKATDGNVVFEGHDVTHLTGKSLKALRKEMQMIFQDPYSSINPRMTVQDIILEPLYTHKLCQSKNEYVETVSKLMDLVGLSKRVGLQYPHELDGGRRQRIGIARALALEPKFIVCDEPVSALDVSIQAQILNLLLNLQEELGLTYIFVTHDLSVVRHISDEICVMYLGQVVERCKTDELFQNSIHPYTRALLSAIPIPKVNVERNPVFLKGEITSPINPKPGCRFAARCSYADTNCSQSYPPLVEVSKDHFVACYKSEMLSAK